MGKPQIIALTSRRNSRPGPRSRVVRRGRWRLSRCCPPSRVRARCSDGEIDEFAGGELDGVTACGVEVVEDLSGPVEFALVRMNVVWMTGRWRGGGRIFSTCLVQFLLGASREFHRAGRDRVQLGHRGVGEVRRQGGQPVVGGLVGVGGPFGQQPASATAGGGVRPHSTNWSIISSAICHFGRCGSSSGIAAALAAGPDRHRRVRVLDGAVVPGLGQMQRPVQRRGRGVGGGVHADRDLAVRDLAQGARVLPGHSRRGGAVLGEAGVVDNPGVRAGSDHTPCATKSCAPAPRPTASW